MISVSGISPADYYRNYYKTNPTELKGNNDYQNNAEAKREREITAFIAKCLLSGKNEPGIEAASKPIALRMPILRDVTGGESIFSNQKPILKVAPITDNDAEYEIYGAKISDKGIMRENPNGSKTYIDSHGITLRQPDGYTLNVQKAKLTHGLKNAKVENKNNGTKIIQSPENKTTIGLTRDNQIYLSGEDGELTKIDEEGNIHEMNKVGQNFLGKNIYLTAQVNGDKNSKLYRQIAHKYITQPEELA